MKPAVPAKLLLILVSMLLSSAGCSNSHVITPKSARMQGSDGKVSSAGKLKGTQKPYHVHNKTYYPLPSAKGYRESGIASWYGPDFHGRQTSSGERYDMHAETAAHKTLPMGTMLLVKNRENGKKTVVRVNDRGPFVKNRIIDLSYESAKKLGILDRGTARVEIIALGETEGEARQQGEETAPRFKKMPDFDRGKFYVQVGAYTNRENAELLARSFLRRGRNVAIQTFFTPDRTFYRVQVFAGTSLKTARLYQQQLAGERFPGAFVIAR